MILLPLETLSGNHEMEVKTKHIKHCIYISINNIENLVSFHFYAIQHFNTQFNNSILLAKHNLQKTSKSHRFSDNFCGNRNQWICLNLLHTRSEICTRSMNNVVSKYLWKTSNCQRIVWVCSIILWGWRLKC